VSLSTQQIAALAAAAVLVFWMVGAYNRLVALRNTIGEAWVKVDDALLQRAAAAEPLLAALREPLAAEAGALDTWVTSMAAAQRAGTQLAARPVASAQAKAWVAAEAAGAAAASRVFALLEQNTELRQQDTVATHALAWRTATRRLAFARQLFNETTAPYNEAIATFPTRLLVRLFRFEAAGRL
jgi:LemA protein